MEPASRTPSADMPCVEKDRVLRAVDLESLVSKLTARVKSTRQSRRHVGSGTSDNAARTVLHVDSKWAVEPDDCQSIDFIA